MGKQWPRVKFQGANKRSGGRDAIHKLTLSERPLDPIELKLKEEIQCCNNDETEFDDLAKLILKPKKFKKYYLDEAIKNIKLKR